VFSGEEQPSAALAINLERLAGYLSSRMNGLSGPLEVFKFKGGQSNPTYRLAAGDRNYVLRRKPPGPLVASAHAIEREYRVLGALAGAAIPTPHVYLYCDDPGIIGTEFYILEHVAGRVFWEAELDGVAPADRAAIYADMNRVLARLHDLDVSKLGLESLGPPAGYAGRNLARWSEAYRASKLEDIPNMEQLMESLPNQIPDSAETTFIHGDFGLSNIIIHPHRPHVAAVLDWEMATLGDPLVDLAHHLRPWWEPGNTGLSATSLLGHDLKILNIPDMRAYIDLYCEQRGISFPDMRWYLAYAQFRYAAMVQGIIGRASQGSASSRVMVHRQERVAEIAAVARATLEGRGPCAQWS
jgi:aminoglycoside phosphotransferase (APT) family kinase protein